MRLDTLPAREPDAISLASEVVRQAASFLAAEDPESWSRDVLLLPRSEERNAQVFLEDGDGAIFLHAGLLAGLWDALVDLVFRSPSIGRLFDWPEAVSGPDWHGPRGARERYLLELYGRAVEFVLFHEAAHLARRHIPLLKDRLGRDFVDESLHMAYLAGETAELLRMVEYDADSTALEWSLNANAWHRLRGGGSDGSDDRDHMRSELLLRILACDAVFLTLDQDRPQAGAVPLTEGHPPSIHRAMRCSAILQDTVCALAGVAAEDAARIAATSVFEIGALAARLSVAPGRWHGTDRAWLSLETLSKAVDAANAFSSQLGTGGRTP